VLVGAAVDDGGVAVAKKAWHGALFDESMQFAKELERAFSLFRTGIVPIVLVEIEAPVPRFARVRTVVKAVASAAASELLAATS